MDIQLIDERVKKAYNRFNDVNIPEIDALALSTLNDYHRKIEGWHGNAEKLQGIGFYRDYLIGNHMEVIASSGAAAINHANYRSIMGQVGTARRMARLFSLRKDKILEPDLAIEIRRVNFFKHIFNNPARKGFRPRIYTNRIIVSIFIEVMTSIADRGHLEETAELLGIANPAEIPFAELQIIVRKVVEESLIRQDLGNDLTKFTRATIAYHVKEACNQ